MATSCLYRYIRRSKHEEIEARTCLRKLTSKFPRVQRLAIESCFYVEKDGRSPLSTNELEALTRILGDDWDESSYFGTESCLQTGDDIVLAEIGPRLSFTSPFSTNSVNICHSTGLTCIKRIERARRYQIQLTENIKQEDEKMITACLFDAMTEQIYKEIPQSLASQDEAEPWTQIDIMGAGKKALIQENEEQGFGFDNQEIESYYQLFKDMQRNPTSVELFDLAQSNSEHSRHWFFKGKYFVDGRELEKSLMQLVIDTNRPNSVTTNNNNIIKFNDNSSGILGPVVNTLWMSNPVNPSKYLVESVMRHIIFTAETHNFPTGVAPFSGATTGTGGRIRDVQAAGKGGRVIAGTAGYCFGNLRIPGYEQPWEPDYEYPGNFATPLEVAIEASNGASDYGNKFGEPVLAGFARSFGMTITSTDKTDSERREWIKPIMFSAGIGGLDDGLIKKEDAQPGDYIVKLGGPVYRIGVGGGAASSVQVQGDGSSERDLLAVQRGDPEMEQKMNRVLISCMELQMGRPIRSIHDQGAGGNANVLKELIEDVGGVIFSKSFTLGDPTLSMLELWGAEYQESNAMLVKPNFMENLNLLAKREKCPIDKVGFVTETGRVQVVEEEYNEDLDLTQLTNLPVDLNLKSVFSGMPQKIFRWTEKRLVPPAASLPDNLKLQDALQLVLRLPSVSSKRYLTNKVDRSVSGLVAQQQCCGPSQMPVSDVAVVALSHFSEVGAATSIGEQPIKMLIDPNAGARMSVIESLTNLCSALISDIKDVKCSANWMWAAKLPGEGYALYSACESMCDIMKRLGVAVDGGKDSLSMAARVKSKDGNSGEIIKAPGSLVISAYAPCPDITKIITPDLKCLSEPNSRSVLLLVKPVYGKSRIGGSALTQVYGQLGCESPDVQDSDIDIFLNAFNVLQILIKEKKIMAMHDVSDGGLLTTILEMAMAGVMGVDINLPKVVQSPKDHAPEPILAAFHEEAGWVIQVKSSEVKHCMQQFKMNGIAQCINVVGDVTEQSVDAAINIKYDNEVMCEFPLKKIIATYEETSYQIERLQMNPDCADNEYQILQKDNIAPYKVNFRWEDLPVDPRPCGIYIPKVAIIREEGTNGDKEMAASFIQSGFHVFDVTMTDILAGKLDFNMFRGLVFPGGFSYADVLGSGVGWSLAIKEQRNVLRALNAWKDQTTTFSLGVCNGCQLMARLGWIGTDEYEKKQSVGLFSNTSGRFESRWSKLKIRKNNSILLKQMEGSILGCWVAHGEGKFEYKSESVREKIFASGSMVMEYVDPQGNATTQYPHNPNGSEYGAAAISSSDGRHLAMMPHPERSTMMWQWPDQSSRLNWNSKSSPWARMFQNAFDWCLTNDQ